MDFDVFISHASEDKDSFVRLLAQKLEEHQILVWYDEFTLKPGSSLRRSIDLGLSKARLGIVVLSDNFFNKRWTNWELDGLVARQNASENDLIIPIWLNITRDQLLAYSPSLADKVAIQANLGIDTVVSKLHQVIKPEGSTLVIARDLVYKAGINAPMVTDDWWLDVVEYSGQEYLYHEYLAFDIPFNSWGPHDRGEYIARHALQKLWQEEGEEILISQLTHPKEVLDFIETQPGLKEIALQQPEKIAFFFPQLTILGLGGFLEPVFDKLLKIPPKYRSEKHPCEEEIAFRHPSFGNYDNGELASIYFTGNGGGIGPSSNRHDQIDYIVWLLSSNSSWLPGKIRNVLLTGLKEWAVWHWSGRETSRSDFEGTENSGALLELLYSENKPKTFKLTKKAILDIKERIAYSKTRLKLPETVEELYNLFIENKIIEAHIMSGVEREKRRNAKE